MWDLIVLLFFGGNISLSPQAVTVTPQCITVTPKKTMVAKWSNAAFIVELPYLPRDHWPEGGNRLDQINRDYPHGRVKVTLYGANGRTVEIANHDVIGVSNSDFQLYLAPAGGFTEGDEFVRASLCADPAIENAHLYWRRVGK
jgi:hypothetical protein